jgi:gliding motility-associated-like protein
MEYCLARDREVANNPGNSLYPKVFQVIIFCVCSALSAMAQDCETRNTYLPLPDKFGADSYGESIDSFEDFLVVGSSGNDSLASAAGLAYVYRLNASQQWEKIAELAPSDPQRSLRFGERVGIFGTSIGIYGSSYDDAGSSTAKLYIFERLPGDQWTSGTETYQVKNNPGLANFKLHDDELITAGSNGLTIYKKSAGTFIQTQSIPAPLDKRGLTSGFGRLAVDDNLIAVGVDQFHHTDNGYSVTFLYEKSGGVYPTVPVRLRPSTAPSEYISFGTNVSIHDETIFVSAAHAPVSPTVTVQSVFVFEKPVTGWADATETVRLLANESLFSDRSMVAADNYIMVSGFVSPQPILGFKKTGANWSSGVVHFRIENPTVSPTFAYQLTLTEDHLIAGCPFLSADVPVEEVVVDFHRPARDWENTTAPAQTLTETAINAANTRFGTSVAVHENLVFVGAQRDDEHATSGGTVYIFDREKPPGTTPLKIFPPIVQNGAGFGNSVAAGKDILVISAPFSDSLNANGSLAMPSIGRVYVYRLVGGVWKYQSQILAPEVTKSGSFGQTVTYWKGYLAVAEFTLSTSQSDGRVHIYKEDLTGKFVRQATLRPELDIRGDMFGHAIIMNDSLTVVGTGSFEYTPGVYRMKVFIYKKKGEWKDAVEDARLLPTKKMEQDLFAFSIAMDGEYIVAGAPGYRDTTSPKLFAGAAYVFKMPPGGWKGTVSEVAQLLPSNPSEYGFFGYSVAISNDDILVGAPHSIDFSNRADFFTNDDNTIKPGTVYHYVREGPGWVSTNNEKRQIQAIEPDWLDSFGASMILDSRTLLVTSPLDDTPSGFLSGSVQSIGLPPGISAVPVLCDSSIPISLRAGPPDGQWEGQGVNSTSGVFNPLVAGPGSHLIRYDVGGCIAEQTIHVVDSKLIVNEVSSATQAKCIGASIPVTFDTNANLSASIWFYKSKESDEYKKLDSLKETITAKLPGYYSVIVRSNICPNQGRTFIIADDQQPTFTFDPVNIICNDQSIQLNAQPPGGIWSGAFVTPGGMVNAAGMGDGGYDFKYTYTSLLKCEYSGSTRVNVDKLTVPAVVKDKDRICGDSPVELSASNIDTRTSINWMDENGNILGNIDRLPVVDAGSYFVRAMKHSCITESDLIKIDAIADSLFVPNVFTPNNDSRNDHFQIEGSDLNGFNLLVYNRYGGLVYENTDPSFKWMGDDLSAGTYFWRITYETCSGDTKEAKGWVQLVR